MTYSWQPEKIERIVELHTGYLKKLGKQITYQSNLFGCDFVIDIDIDKVEEAMNEPKYIKERKTYNNGLKRKLKS